MGNSKQRELKEQKGKRVWVTEMRS